LICLSRALGSQHTALMQIGYRKRGLQIRTGASFKCGQIQAAAGTAVKIEDRRAIRHPAFDADMEANAVDGRHIVGFREVHAASMS